MGSENLRPVRADIPPARQRLAEALREQFGRLDLSIRRYAQKSARTPSSITRYLNGTILPPESFVTDLIDDVAQSSGRPALVAQAEMMGLYRSAQDAQPGGWGRSKRLQQEAARAVDRARRAEEAKAALVEEHRLMRRQLEATQTMLDELANGEAGDRRHLAREEFLLLELERSRTELASSLVLLRAAEDRRVELEREVRSLRATVENAAMPVGFTRNDGPPTSWYRPRGPGRGRYWREYSERLRARWPTPALTSLDAATDQIIERLADPAGDQPYQARGLVLGPVQSSQSSNIAGLVAKAVDAGYRLVIVLSGPHNAMRRQLQELLDLELPSLPDTSGIVRLTTSDMDYQELGERLRILEFEKVLPELALNESRNLQSASVRLMVVKKNMAVLRRLLTDLQAIRTPLAEVPCLVVDAEPRPWIDEGALNRLTSRLLEILPRAQYVAYSSIPLTEAFADPTNAESLHPRDFVVSLPRLAGHTDA